ncbi:LysM peptidoglycan-binding domain-containing protein [Leifsonia sp. YIM 134122]|uniref:LysM peptidoglycan-binding domain-containing protein n=1 Tax=Leifsonia stereocauli TaxID=3134136 RepID=A0ABU9W3D9_9MICO
MSLAPVAIASAIAMTLGGTAPVTATPAKRMVQPSSNRSAQATPAAVSVHTANPPATYTVVAGDTVSGLAERFGLETGAILALNGLDRSSLIFPGQGLVLVASPQAAPKPAAPKAADTSTGPTHTVVAGDTVSGIAAAAGLSTQQVLDANGLAWSSVILPGQKLRLSGSASTTAAAPVAPVAQAVTPVAQAAPVEVHTVVAGDTISDIAASAGQSIQAILDANKLDWSSYIVPGQQIVIPSPPSPEAARSAVKAGRIAELSDSMRTNAATIVAVGRELGVSDQGIVVALAAAAQESGLENVDYGDRDSLGLFQQRPSTGWGTPAEVRDPLRAAKAFFGGSANPNPGRTRGLLDVAGWEKMTVTQAAQAVQISAYPDAYAKWEPSARAWLAILG